MISETVACFTGSYLETSTGHDIGKSHFKIAVLFFPGNCMISGKILDMSLLLFPLPYSRSVNKAMGATESTKSNEKDTWL